MRILIVSNLFPPAFLGGYELAAQDVAYALAGRGHQVAVLSSPPLDGAPDSATPFRLIRTLECLVAQAEVITPDDLVHRGLGINLRNVSALVAAQEEVRPDVVLCFNLAGLGPLALLRMLGLCGAPGLLVLMDNPFVFADRDPALDRRLRRLLGLGPGLGTARAVSCSDSLTAELSAVSGAALHLPVVPNWARPGPRPEARDGPIRFVFTSRIAPHKGMNHAVEAMALLRACCKVPFTLDVWGGGMPAEMMMAAHAAGVGDICTYRGLTTKAEMISRYADYDAMLFPTWEREPFGFVVSEAAASGCVPIFTASIGAAEFLLDGLHCLKIPPTAEGLADAMHRLATMTSEDRLALRRRAWRQACRALDAERCFDRLEAEMVETMAADRRRTVAPSNVLLAFTALAHIWRSVDGR